jgi:hypothetical protein
MFNEGISVQWIDGYLVIKGPNGFEGQLSDIEDPVNGAGSQNHPVTLPPELEYKLCFKEPE